LRTHLLRWWIAVAEIIIYAKSVDNLYIVAKVVIDKIIEVPRGCLRVLDHFQKFLLKRNHPNIPWKE
jgi:hypothetical protein